MIRHLSILPLFTTVALFASAASAGTAGGTPIPEPGMLELLGLGIAVAVAIKLRRK